MDGMVIRWDEQKPLGVIASGREKFIVLRDDIEPDDAGRRYLILNEPVTFEISPERATQAINVHPHFRESVPVEHEIVILRVWNGTYGWARRAVGGGLYVHVNEIRTLGIETLGPNSKLWVIAAPPAMPSHKTWRGIEIDIVNDEEIQQQ
jgi:cold shock CspA family protein